MTTCDITSTKLTVSHTKYHIPVSVLKLMLGIENDIHAVKIPFAA